MACGRRKPEDLVTEAVSQYLDDQKWESLLTAEERPANGKALTEADVPDETEETNRMRF